MQRRHLLAGAAGAIVARPALAQGAWPNRTIRMIVPYTPGAATDAMARLAAQKLQEKLGVTVVVENRPGANGAVGSQAVLQSPADGYTIVLHTLSSGVMNAGLYSNMPFDLRRAFAPVGLVGTVPNIIVVNPRLQAQIKPEGVEEAIAAVGYAWASEQQHRDRIKQILRWAPSFFETVARTIDQKTGRYFVCQVCGSTVNAIPAGTCPICKSASTNYRGIEPPA